MPVRIFSRYSPRQCGKLIPVLGTATAVQQKIEQITGRQPWLSIVDVEPIGPKELLDLLLIAPCTGNSMAKLARGLATAQS